MQAFHNKPEVKQFYVDRLTEHHRLDQIIQGTGFDGSRGCNVGCILHAYQHDRYPIELGLPEWYAQLCDTIFEGLPKENAPAFAMSTLSAIKIGVDIEHVRWQLAIERHKIDLLRLKDNSEPYARECEIAIQKVIDYCFDELNHVFKDNESAESAARSAVHSAARSAVQSASRSEVQSAARSATSEERSARSAVQSAAWSAAWSAAESAVQSAARSAESAARSAESAARSAVRNHFIWEAETLIRLLTEIN